MVFCYASIVRDVWRRAGRQAARNIDEPRVHFVTSRRSATASDTPAVCLTGPRHKEDMRRQSPCLLARCHGTFPLSWQDNPRQVTLTTKRSVIRMAISVTAGFMVCITPVFVVTSVRVYSDYRYTWKAANVVTGLMALSHSAVNPFLYILFSTRAVHAVFAHLCRRAEPRCCQLTSTLT